MKTAKLLLATGLIIGSLTSCDDNGWFCIKGNGDIDTEVRNVPSFNEVELDFNAEVYVSQGSTHEVKIVASENLLEHIETDVVGNTLKLDVRGGSCINEDDDDDVKIYITSADYKMIELSGSGEISNLTPLDLVDLEVDINGSGDIDLNGISADDLEVYISGSGEVKLSGDTIDSGIIKVSGSGDVHATNLPIDDLEIKISGSGDADVNVVSNLTANISGSGDVKYKGNPVVNTNITGSGSVSQQ